MKGPKGLHASAFLTLSTSVIKSTRLKGRPLSYRYTYMFMPSGTKMTCIVHATQQYS